MFYMNLHPGSIYSPYFMTSSDVERKQRKIGGGSRGEKFTTCTVVIQGEKDEYW